MLKHELKITITEGAPRQISEVHEEVCYSARRGVYMDGTWLQLMCYAHPDVQKEGERERLVI